MIRYSQFNLPEDLELLLSQTVTFCIPDKTATWWRGKITSLISKKLGENAFLEIQHFLYYETCEGEKTEVFNFNHYYFWRLLAFFARWLVCGKLLWVLYCWCPINLFSTNIPDSLEDHVFIDMLFLDLDLPSLKSLALAGCIWKLSNYTHSYMF